MLCGANQVFEIDYLQDERWPKYINVESDTLYRVLFTIESVGPYKVCSCNIASNIFFILMEKIKYSKKAMAFQFETNAFCPCFHKEKSVGWIVIIGEKDTSEVLCCKKFSPITGSKQLTLPFKMPKRL